MHGAELRVNHLRMWKEGGGYNSVIDREQCVKAEQWDSLGIWVMQSVQVLMDDNIMSSGIDADAVMPEIMASSTS